jgi:hypothetical protein
MAVFGEKLSGGPADYSAGLGVVSGALFVESSRVRPTLLMACERLPPMWTGVGSVYVMCIGFSPVGCISIQIDATAKYE